jgi:FAD/FMN-containing dehydrogenase
MTETAAVSLDELRKSCPGLELAADPDVLQNHGRDWTRFRQPRPMAVAFPRDAAEVASLVAAARHLGMALVPSGGRTGLSGGAVAAQGELVVSMDRMRRILDFDPVDRLVTVEAGVVTAAIQAFAREHDLFYPVSFAAEGSAQIGGNIATNAGGIRVLRYGLTRDRVAGLKVVDGRGRLLDLNRGLVKNASGYDLRHLLIGSEGTLGIIVEATLSLVDRPRPSRVLLLGLDAMPRILDVMRAMREKLSISACEFFSEPALRRVCEARSLRPPIDTACPFYLLIEFDEPAGHADRIEADCIGLFERLAGLGWVREAVLSHSEEQAAAIWACREGIAEAAAPFTPYKNDLSVRLSRLPAFLEALEEQVAHSFPEFEVFWYGHAGDGNLHMNILKPPGMEVSDFEVLCKRHSAGIYALTERFGGSISAEHGIGLMKSPFLANSRSEAEIELMRGIKRVFDPDGILNPGKLFPAGGGAD